MILTRLHKSDLYLRKKFELVSSLDLCHGENFLSWTPIEHCFQHNGGPLFSSQSEQCPETAHCSYRHPSHTEPIQRYKIRSTKVGGDSVR
jgi:hypothetical protein